MSAPTVALIHGTPTAMSPAREAFTELFPDARLWNLLDDRLISDADAAGGLTPGLTERMRTLIEYAVANGADTALLTCSMYGPAANGAQWPVPVYASDQAMFDRVRVLRPARIAVLGPLPAGVADTVNRLRALGPGTIDGITVDGTLAASRGGDLDRLRDLLVGAARQVAAEVDAIVLGQYSISPAAAAVSAAVPVPVLSPAHLAARAVRAALSGAGPR
nr:hypothetical protein [Micromonospora sp. DSM 115978]